MNARKLILRSLVYYFRRNLLLALGIAISTAVLTGALIVGDSVSYSLNRIVEQRLGHVTHTLETGDRYFTLDLAEKVSKKNETDVAPVLMLDGVAVTGGGQKRVSGIQVVGVDSLFDTMAGLQNYYGRLQRDSVYISSNLAERLNVGKGDDILLRMTRASMVPLNAPFVSDARNIVSLRVSVAGIPGPGQLGAFNLKNSQTAPFNIFIAAERLQEVMELGDRANLMLFSGHDLSESKIDAMIRDAWTVRDVGLQFDYQPSGQMLEIKSSRIFIDRQIAEAIENTGWDPRPVLTYFVNEIRHAGRATPYSFVASLAGDGPGPGGIIINEWLASDLGAEAGDSVTMTYYSVGPLRDLDTRERTFTVHSVVPMSGIYGDAGLMPDIPGLSDAGNCRDWDTGVPIELESIRDKDEEYWEQYRGTPKAFIALPVAEELWENRFGKYTAFRMHARADELMAIQSTVMKALSPGEVGFRVKAVYEQGKYAAGHGVDFSQLFGGLSFFLLAGAILLSVLLFRLNLEERREQGATLISMGIPGKTVMRVMLAEGLWVALAGAMTGVFLAMVYNQLVFHALNSIWMDIVRTGMLVTEIRVVTLVTGFAASMVIASLALLIPLRKYINELKQRHVREALPGYSGRSVRMVSWSAVLTGLVALILLLLQLRGGDVVSPGIFFAAGGLLLVAGILFIVALLGSARFSEFFVRGLTALGLKNALRNNTRSLTIVILLAIGTFLVISTGSNRKDLFVNAEDPSSGTGGFLYYAESTVPVLKDLSDSDVRFEYGLGDGYDIVQFRVAKGDDASCLNLNRILNPRILGVDPEKLSGRFSFVTASRELEGDRPWSTLDQELEGGLVPAIADETVIKWGLGMKVGDTLRYEDSSGNEMKLLLTGGLAPSIFQGSVIISQKQFLERFPGSSGTEVFLVEGDVADTARISEELGLGMRDLGWSMEYAPRRLTEFNSVTNTYLSIFLVMGALGLLLGTIGLSIVLYRSILERREELALLKALGYGRRKIRSVVMREYLLLLTAGTLIGSLAAVIATLPALLSPNNGISIIMILAIIFVLLLNGITWIWWMSGAAVRRKAISEALRNE